jgi:PBP1b-binding outer membrane lipoprotein LpoB
MKPVYIMLLIGALLLPGCGKDKVKPSEDYVLSQKVFESINTIKEAYMSKSKSTLKNRIEDPLSDSIINALSFKKAELSLNQRLIRISDDTVKVSISWQGSWQLTDDSDFKNRGVADLIFNKETLKLSGMSGDNPFVLPEMKK